MTPLKWHIAVLIPASNEQDLLPRCLTSIKEAGRLVESFASVDIVLAVDHSVDQTKSIGQAMLADSGIVIETDGGIVGEARARAAQVALDRYEGRHDLCWLVNTDADSFVPEGWLQSHLKLAQRGVQAIAGTVDVDTFKEHASFVKDRFRRSYLISADGSHPHVHGTNFGIRADWYLRAGGGALSPRVKITIYGIGSREWAQNGHPSVISKSLRAAEELAELRTALRPRLQRITCCRYDHPIPARQSSL